MNKTINGLLCIVVGAGIGSLVTWKFTKTYYERIAQEEINSVKEVFSKKSTKNAEEEPKNTLNDKPSLEEYAKILNENGYGKAVEKGDTEDIEEPELISPEEFGEIDYETKSYTYYHVDKVLADELDDVVEDVNGTVGPEALGSFGEYVDDAVYVRNNQKRIDYEILLDNRSYWNEVAPYLKLSAE